MPRSKSHYDLVLKFWRSVETFAMPDMPESKKLGPGKQMYRLDADEPLPWEDERYRFPDEEKQWRHTLYFHIVEKEAVMKVLETYAPRRSDEFRDPVSGFTCLAALVVDQYGQPNERSYARSTFPYGIKILQERRDPEELQDLLKTSYDEFNLRFGTPEVSSVPDDDGEGFGPEDEEGFDADDDESAAPAPAAQAAALSREQLGNELEDLATLIGGRLPTETPIVVLSEQVKAGAEPEAAFLNSYYLNDLNTLIAHVGDAGKPLETYLSQDIDEKDRWNLLEPMALLLTVNPRCQSPGRWPANPAHGLYSAQVAALQLTILELREQPGLWGINGPPGTGKTTLLREVIANAVVTRAQRLLEANVSKIFSAKHTLIADYTQYFEFDERLFGNDGILVSSNNNSAVENISRELPSVNSIDWECFADLADYFSGVAQNLNDKTKCWGLLSAVLGNASNRYAFNRDFWFDRQNGMDAFLRSQEDPALRKTHLEAFAETAETLRSLLKDYQEYHALASAHHTALLKVLKKAGGGSAREVERLATQLTSAYGIPARNLPGPGFLSMPLFEIHQMTPYSSDPVNELRSRIFLMSLQLHQCAILVNARQFRSNLGAFVDMLAGKHTNKMDEPVRKALWGSFFFCIPLVSATLASVEKLFSRMGKGSIGWLLLDEAGQANPAHACGAIWRSEKCILIGDTLQVPPVVTIPEGLADLLQEQYSLGPVGSGAHWSPRHSSAQLLADRATPVGAYISIETTSVWTGIPLRAHRRCQEPMFGLANAIAYNDQMVKLTVDQETQPPLPSSRWIDVAGGEMVNRHTVKREETAVQQLLADLLFFGYGDEKEVFIISPFKLVADHFREKLARRKVSSGTIHTFQGKEADVVILVLGTDRKNTRARQWASAIPNMLNVAITRAKKRLYVIGNRQDWAACRYFGEMAKELEVFVFDAGEEAPTKTAVRRAAGGVSGGATARPVVFISYSWDDDAHNAWVLRLAERLTKNGIEVILDKYKLRLGKSLPHFIEESIALAQRVLVIFTPNYRLKADKRTGGVGYEYSILNNDLYNNQTMNDKIIPVLRKGSMQESIPSFMQQYIHLDLRDDTIFEAGYTELIRDIYNDPAIKPPEIGSKPDFS